MRERNIATTRRSTTSVGASAPRSVLAGVCLLVMMSGFASVARAAVETAARAEKRVALVVGNARYRLAPLANPENDARLISARLRDLGFDVREHLNLGKRDFRDTVRAFAREMQNSPGVVLFYFAGHGVQIDGRNYLLPVDANLSSQGEVKDDSVDVQDLFVSRLESSRALTRIVILDACRDNPFGRRTRDIRAAGGLAEMAARGTLIAYASAPGATAEDGPSGSNSVYTRNLAEEMMTPGLDVEMMFKRVRIRVLKDTGERQVPWVNTSLTTSFTFSERVGPDPAELARNALLRKLEEELASTRKLLLEARDRADQAEAGRLAALATDTRVSAAPTTVPMTAATTAATTSAPAKPFLNPSPSAVVTPVAPVSTLRPVTIVRPATPATSEPPATSPVMVASAPSKLPQTAASKAARDRAASDARREVDRLLEQLQVVESAVAAARESSRIDAVRRASAPPPPPPPLVVAAPRARAPTKPERCADLLTRMSIGDAIGAEAERFLHQECQ